MEHNTHTSHLSRRPHADVEVFGGLVLAGLLAAAASVLLLSVF